MPILPFSGCVGYHPTWQRGDACGPLYICLVDLPLLLSINGDSDRLSLLPRSLARRRDGLGTPLPRPEL